MSWYQGLIERRATIIQRAVGIDYGRFEQGPLAFDYEGLMASINLSLAEVQAIQAEAGVGQTPLLELRNLTRLVRQFAGSGRGARLFMKDEAANPSGSFKDRRAALSVWQARTAGYRGVIAATSGNYGAAVASQAAKWGLRCIIVQEAFDSRGQGQPEILEKGRVCEAYGAEVVQLTVGPELFAVTLGLLEETGFFNASLYSPYGIAGVETLGVELVDQVKAVAGRPPAAVVITHAGGGNVTGTARGVNRALWGEPTRRPGGPAMIGASVDLRGLHMASDKDFNRKSFTTGHTGFGVPFLVQPDRVDLPRSAARPLRYLDRYLLVPQGSVFYVTELLAQLEGLERGPAGNTALAAALQVAAELPEDEIVVVQESEYTGAGKLPSAQLTFAKSRGVAVSVGDPADNRPGERIVLPEQPAQLGVEAFNLDQARRSYLRQALQRAGLPRRPALGEAELAFLALEVNRPQSWVEREVGNLDL